ncbi:MAG TPA: hypothetical protein VMB50_18215 [Myxococcales bacterium]|nr:hypothetical protein [Myxococcales bacterium]
MRLEIAKTPALLVILMACASGVPEPLPQLGRFHFPTGMDIDVPYSPDAGRRARFLYIAGNSNFDQAASRGVVMAVDLDGYGPPATGLVPPGMVDDGGWDGTPLSFPDVGDAGTVDPAVGWVYTDSLGGELRLVPTSAGGERVLLATRAQNRLAFIDVDAGALSCVGGDGGRDCLDDTSSPPLVVYGQNGGNQILDVFSVSPPVRANLAGGGEGPPEVFVGHLRNISTAVEGVFGVPANPYSSVSTPTSLTNVSAYIVRQNVDDPTCRMAEPIGTVPAAGVVGVPSPSGLFTVATGRFIGASPANVQVMSLPPPTCPPPPPPAGEVSVDPTPPTPNLIDLSQILKETDGRALALSTNGDRVFALSIGPDAIVILRIDGKAPGSLNIHPSTVVSVPTGPSELLPIPRTRPDGRAVGDLVAITCPGSEVLAFYDDELGMVTAALPGVGDEPFAVVSAPRTLGNGPGATILPGVRLFVSAFGSGQVAVVDVPNLMDATTARVIALLGSYEDTTASPVNPLTSQILTLPYGYSGSPGI